MVDYELHFVNFNFSEMINIIFTTIDLSEFSFEVFNSVQNIFLKACLNYLKTANLFNIKQKFKINKLISYSPIISNRTTVRGLCEVLNLLKYLIKSNTDNYQIILHFAFI